MKNYFSVKRYGRKKGANEGRICMSKRFRLVLATHFVLLCLFCNNSIAHAACEPHFTPIVGTLSVESVNGLAVSGDYAYLTTWYGLTIVDVSTPASPVQASSLEGIGSCYGVAVSGSYAYLASESYGLFIVDVSNPEAPVLAGSLATPAYQVAVSGAYAYVVGSAWLQVVDVSNPASPVIVGSADLPDWPNDVAVSGSYAYVAVGLTGLCILDVSAPASPSIVGSIDTLHLASGVAIDDSYVYVADGYAGLVIIDVSLPAVPFIAGTVAAGLPFDTATDVAVNGDIAFVTSYYAGLQIVDITSPVESFVIGSAPVQSSFPASYVAWDGDYAYVVAYGYEENFLVVDVSDPLSPHMISYHSTLGPAYGIDVSGNYAYVAEEWEGVEILDISDPAAPEIVGGVDTPGRATELIVSGNFAYVADGWGGGLQVLDVTNPSTPHIEGSVATPGLAVDIALSGNYAYVADSTSLLVVDVSSPQSPFIAGSLDISALRVAASGSYVYVVGSPTGLRVVDCSNPAAPVVAGMVELSGPRDVEVQGSYVYVAAEETGNFGVHVVDVSNPSAPYIVGWVGAQGEIHKIELADSCAYIAGNSYTYSPFLQVIEISDPAFPISLGSFSNGITSYDVAVSASHAYLAHYAFGISVVQLCPELFRINLEAPADLAVLSQPPTFSWTASGGTNNAFAVDVSASAGFTKYWSTYENLHQIITETSWAMSPAVWDMIPAGARLYWRVRGADLDVAPLDIITSDEVWSFTKE